MLANELFDKTNGQPANKDLTFHGDFSQTVMRVKIGDWNASIALDSYELYKPDGTRYLHGTRPSRATEMGEYSTKFTSNMTVLTCTYPDGEYYEAEWNSKTELLSD